MGGWDGAWHQLAYAAGARRRTLKTSFGCSVSKADAGTDVTAMVSPMALKTSME